MAMAVRGSQNHYRIAEIMRRHWLDQGRQAGLPAEEVETVLATLKGAVEHAIAMATAQLPADFPADVADRVFKGLRAQARKL